MISPAHFFGPFNKKEKPIGNKIIFGKFVVVGTNSVILPGAGSIPEGVSIGALSLVNSKLKKWSIYTGNPAKFILPRKKLIKRKSLMTLSNLLSNLKNSKDKKFFFPLKNLELSGNEIFMVVNNLYKNLI